MPANGPSRFHITTFGCQMNVYDSARLAGLLFDQGYDRASGPQDADVLLILTCSVRDKAQHKVLTHLGSLAGLKKRRPGLIIGLGGCVAQQEGEALLKRFGHLDLVFGPGGLERTPELVAQARRGIRGVALELGRDPGQLIPRRQAQTGPKALLTVMRGCDNFCSYCVVPYVRGREVSRPAAEVVDEAQALLAAGAREITLLGQNVNSYHDPESGGDFADLLRRVAALDELWRLRFVTSHPKDLSPRLIEAMATEPKVMRELHLPVQSGADRVLKAMNRGYDRAHYLGLVRDLRQAMPDLVLGSDIIVGFPGETEDEFRQTMSLLEEVRYGFMFSFMYSDRPFTKASRMDAKLDLDTKAARLAELQERQREISLELHRAEVGRVVEVLVEGPARKGEGVMSGRDHHGRMVNFPGGPELAGHLVEVCVTEGTVNSLLGQWRPREGNPSWLK